MPQWDKCVNVNGDCVEVWCVPCATNGPCIHRSQHKVFVIRVFTAYFFCSFLLCRILSAFGKLSLSNQRINCPPVEPIIGCVDKEWS